MRTLLSNGFLFTSAAIFSVIGVGLLADAPTWTCRAALASYGFIGMTIEIYLYLADEYSKPQICR